MSYFSSKFTVRCITENLSVMRINIRINIFLNILKVNNMRLVTNLLSRNKNLFLNLLFNKS